MHGEPPCDTPNPQADGQTEIMNQVLEIALCCYIDPQLDNWVDLLPVFAFSYNSTVHTATKQLPAFLLRGFQPLTPSNLLSGIGHNIPRPAVESSSADNFIQGMNAAKKQAQDALVLAQSYQKKAYNKGQNNIQFQPGDKVLINPHTLKLLKDIKGLGSKLLMKYDGPFEVMSQVSPVPYHLCLPKGYMMHPVINIAHLEPYASSSPEFGEHPSCHLNRESFEEAPKYEVEKIIDEKLVKQGLKRHIDCGMPLRF